MRRFIFILLMLLLPYSMVAVAQDTPTPEGAGSQPGGEVLPQETLVATPEASLENQGGGGQVENFDITATAFSIIQATQQASAILPAQGEDGQCGGMAQDCYGINGYYNPNAQYPGYIQHHVAYGENLFRISLRYGVPIYAIQSANPIIRNINLIYAGTVLLIPTGEGYPNYPPLPSEPGYPPNCVQIPKGPCLTVTPYDPQYPTYTPPAGCIQIPKGPCLTATPYDPQYPTYTPPVGCVQIPKGPCLTPTVPGDVTVTSQPPQSSFELGGQVFGYANAADMRNALMTWSKVQIRWQQGEDTSAAQAAIDEANAQGFKILLSITGVPAELQANPTQYYQNFAAYLGSVAALGPDAIEVWNEQNIDREWPIGMISPASYTQMLSSAYQAIKAADASVMVISGAPAPTGFFGGACTGAGCDDAPFIQGMAANGAANFTDCIGIHYNEGILPPTATNGDPRQNSSHYTRYYPSMVNTYAAAFPSKPLCFTELGYLSPEGYPPLPDAFAWAETTTVQNQADWLAQAVQLSRQSGRIRMAIVWNVNATEYGADPQAGYAIVRPGNTCPSCVALNGVMQ